MVSIAGHAGIVYRYNGAGFLTDRRFNFGFIDIHRIATNIDKDDFAPRNTKALAVETKV